MANLEVISRNSVPGSVCYRFIGPTIVSIFVEIMVHFQHLHSKNQRICSIETPLHSQGRSIWCKAQPA